MANNIPEEEALKYGGTSGPLEKMSGATSGPLEKMPGVAAQAIKEGYQEAAQEAVLSAQIQQVDQMPGRMVSQEDAMQFEDLIMNQFLDQELELFPTPGIDKDPKYNSLSKEVKEMHDFAALQFFQQAQQLKSEENPKYKNMDFTNFVKLFVPDDGFVDVLRDGDGEGTPAKIWFDIYSQNTNLMKESAFKALRRMISAQI